MKHSKTVKITLLALILIFAIGCLYACGSNGSYTVKLMDGENEYLSLSAEPGKPIDLPSPEKAGYAFVGWYTDADLTTPYVDSTEVNSNLTLYAKYTKKGIYIIIDTDGGVEIDPVSVSTGSTYKVPAPTKEGYDFAGYTKIDDMGQKHDFPLTGTCDASASFVITAKWQVKTYTVTFMNGDKEAAKRTGVEHGKETALANVTKEGYTFVGWFDEDDKEFTENTKVKSNVTVYAKFAANAYKIAVKANGGDAMDDVDVTFDGEYELTIPTRTGYTFTGYTYNSEPFDMNGKYTIAGDITVVANWAINSYAVTFVDVNAVMGKEENIIATQTVEHNAKPAAIESGDAAYTIDGYYADEEKTQAVNVNDIVVTGDVTVYVAVSKTVFTITVNGYPAANTTAQYGETYTLTAKEDVVIKEGYLSFYGYYMEDTTESEEFAVSGTYEYKENITVYALFEADPDYGFVFIAIASNLNNYAELGVDLIRIKKGTAIADADLEAIDTTRAGYDFEGWYIDKGCIDELDSSVIFDKNSTIYAKYVPHTFTISIDENGGNSVDDVTVAYLDAYTLPTLTKRGYTFAGYKYNDATITASGAYTYTTDITVVAQWTRNTVTVSLKVNGAVQQTLTAYQYQTLYDIESDITVNPTMTGYTFGYWMVDGEKLASDEKIAEDVELTAYFTPNTYQIIVKDGDVVIATYDVVYGTFYELPIQDKDGYVFDGYLLSGREYAQHGIYSVASSTTVTVKWNVSVDNFVEVAEAGYFKERANSSEPYTYVFMMGGEYNFSQDITVSDLSESGMVTMDGNKKFTANKLGTFKIKFGDNVRNAKVVYEVRTFATGAGYNNMLINAASDEKYMVTANKDTYVMEVGSSNYQPELNIVENGGVTVNADTVDMKVRVKDSSNETVDSAKYTVSNGSISFDSTLVGSTLKVILMPKYALTENNLTETTFTVKLNNGINVYTDSDMRRAYQDLSVRKINVLRNIQAAIATEDYISGHGKQMGNVTIATYSSGSMVDGSAVTLENIDLGAPINDFGHGVYTRKMGTTANDSIVINGNYFFIDGSKLPYIDNRYDKYGAGSSQFTDGGGFRVANVQIGMFLYRCADLNNQGSTIRLSADSGLTINNLRIETNCKYEYSTKEQDLRDGDAKNLLKMSASYIGLVVRGGTLNLDNVSIANTCMGMMLDGGVYSGPNYKQAVAANLNNCIIDRSWASAVYTYDLCKLSLKNSKIGTSGGAAISVDDIPYPDVAEGGSRPYVTINTEIYMDMYSAAHIENYVVGDEAWFVAYGQTQTAAKVKSDMNNMVVAASDGMKVNRIINGVEKFNFAILVRSAGSSRDDCWYNVTGNQAAGTYDKDGCPHVDIPQTINPDIPAIKFFYGDANEMAAIAGENKGRPYLEYYTGTQGNDVMGVIIPLYTAAE